MQLLSLNSDCIFYRNRIMDKRAFKPAPLRPAPAGRASMQHPTQDDRRERERSQEGIHAGGDFRHTHIRDENTTACLLTQRHGTSSKKERNRVPFPALRRGEHTICLWRSLRHRFHCGLCTAVSASDGSRC